jgi:hypothetical protein
MQVVISGFDSKEVLVEKAIFFYANRLGIEPKTISVYVNDSMVVCGGCYAEDENEFMIDVKVKDRTLTEIFMTLGHEMVHIKQYTKNNLAKAFTTSIPYYDRWWEKEAYELEVVLIKEFSDFIAKGN